MQHQIPAKNKKSVALNNIAGIMNKQRNVFGMMPHPEHAVEKLLGNEDGARIFRSIKASLSAGVPAGNTAVPPGL